MIRVQQELASVVQALLVQVEAIPACQELVCVEVVQLVTGLHQTPA